jgi:phosphoglycerate dehydrogenase-like enzyme
MRACVFHPTMGDLLAQRLAAQHPALQVDVVSRTWQDPAHRDEIELLIANTFPRGMLGRCPRLRWLHLTGTGTDHVPAGEPRPGLVVTTSARVPAVPVAEFAWMAVLALAKDAVTLVDQQRRREWRLPEAHRVAGSRLLLVGLGRIGTEIAKRAATFDVQVTAVTRTARPSPWVERSLPPECLPVAAATADHLVLAVPDTPGTRGLVDAAVLDRLPRHATVVNVGRASVLDTAALVARLRAGRLRGAVLDVHDVEPPPCNADIWDVPNLWLTPHGAYRFREEEQQVAEVLLENLTDFTAGRPLRDRVEFEELAPC